MADAAKKSGSNSTLGICCFSKSWLHALARLEEILKQEKNSTDEPIFEAMTQEELNQRIDQAESDFRNKRYKNSAELLAKYE